MEKERYILHIAVQTPLRQTFDYLLPPTIPVEKIKVGIRVKVPFRKKELVGMVVDIDQKTAVSLDKLKEISSVIDEEALLTSQLLSLLNFASQYYQHPIGDVIFSSLPPLLREGEPAKVPEESVYTLTEQGATASDLSLKHAVQQQKLIKLLKEHPNGLNREAINQSCGQLKALTALLAKGYIRKHVRKQSAFLPNKAAMTCLELNDYQKAAVSAIINNLGFGTFLLEGVTGSGKTEVYLQCIDHVLKQNKQALILIPEIGLTPQTVARFQSRFGVPISVLHSGLNDKERTYAWLSAVKGDARIVIGTRSAILTPLPQLGVIILDEEHDASFKQQSGFRYSARDLSIMRAKQEGVTVILGSATPCLESLYNVKRKRFHHVILPKRAGNALQPKFHLVDVRNVKLEEGFSAVVLERMREHLNNSEQVLIFLNRRGFAPTLLCHHCGWTANCFRCDARLTYHSHLEKLVCHHCASMHPLFKRCHACQSDDLVLLGLGTQRVEKLLNRYFPDIPVSRIDSDSTKRKGAMERMLSTIHEGSRQILIGTQMLAKGHHFPNVTMVAIIDIDNGLYSADFRSVERLGQIIVQVAGRAGRCEKPGEVYLQTHNPNHPLLAQLLTLGYMHFAEFLLQERREAVLPPYSHLVLFRAEASDSKLSHLFLSDVRKLLSTPDNKLQIFGPIPALMKKKAGKYRAQLLIQTQQRGLLQQILYPRLSEIDGLPSSRKVRWSLDVDPIDLF
jgi:primosomal protein N' (replication factor Y)